MPATAHALSSFMMFPASNAHACTVTAVPFRLTGAGARAPEVSSIGQS